VIFGFRRAFIFVPAPGSREARPLRVRDVAVPYVVGVEAARAFAKHEMSVALSFGFVVEGSLQSHGKWSL